MLIHKPYSRKEIMETKKVTLLEIAEAMQKNGYKKGKRSYVQGAGDKIEACAIGQAALNLGVDPHNLEAELNRIEVFGLNSLLGVSLNLGASIIQMNDSTDMSVGEIGKLVTKYAKKWPDLEFNLPTKTYN